MYKIKETMLKTILHNFNNVVSCNKSKNQIYIIVITRANADERH